MSSPSADGLRALLERGATRADLASFLDALEPPLRVNQALDLPSKLVGRLYRAVAGGPRLEIEAFVPKETPTGRTIIFEGLNSLPAFRRFQKRFARVSSGQVVGYNHQATSLLTGPGFFVVKPPSDHGDVPGELYFDYTDVPHEVPDGWPAYRTNASGLSKLVYENMKDYMRQVAGDVFVGHAYKLGKMQGQFFVLCKA